ncbi:MAG: hypothetical protein U1D35_02335 [Paracoccaceae bacterium]|nr:hypothetical protein [Paracoccaceae bacterium]
MKALLFAMSLMLLPDITPAQTVVIRNDVGGNVNEYRGRRAKLAQAEAVRIEGRCFSACAIFTTLPNACVMPRAQIGFHGTLPKSGIEAVDYWLDMRLGDYFRGEVKRRYIAQWRHLGGVNQMHVLSGRALNALDPQVQLCKGKPRPVP